MEKTENLYEVLGVPRQATGDQIKAARRRHARDLHPDREHGDQSKMARINAAYEVLSDPERRKRYDETGQTSAEQTREQAVRQVFVKALHSVINDKGNLVLNLRRTMSEAIDESTRLIEEAEEAVKLARKRARRIKQAKGADSLLLETLEAHAASGEDAVAKAKYQLEILSDARKLVDGYESDEEDVPPEPMSFADILMTELNGRKRGR